MAVFFFDICDGSLLSDQQGVELADINAAQAHCLAMAATFLQQPPSEIWRDHAWEIVLRDAAGGPLYRLAFCLTQTRAGNAE